MLFFLHIPCFTITRLPLAGEVSGDDSGVDWGSVLSFLASRIASRAANYDWPFGTLPFGLFGSNLDTRDLETYPRTYSSYFSNMSIFDNSTAI